MKLIYQHKLVRKGIAAIFVNTECDGYKYENAIEKGSHAARIFNEVLNFDEVTTYTNLSYHKIQERMKKLKETSMKVDERF